MSRYRGPRLRIVRRIGLLPGLTKKVSQKLSLPGQQGSNSLKKKFSEFHVRLKEKQKLRFHYGITERQLLNYVKKARKKKGSAGYLLLTFLEMRLDNILFRLGFAPTIFSARQLVNHGHIIVNSKFVTIPSYICQPKNVIRVKNSFVSQSLVKRNLELLADFVVPQHLILDRKNIEAKVASLVNRKSISLLVNELLVVEYYSRKL
jgi:small subunit ribosomal protein S4